MKIRSFFSAISMSGILLASVAEAQTCSSMRRAYLEDKITEAKWECGNDKQCRSRQIAQLYITAQFFKFESEKPLSQMSGKELEEALDPIYSRFLIADKTYESVNISLGDNPFVLLFNEGTTKATDVHIDDGTILDGKTFCDDLALEPLIDRDRVAGVCVALLPDLQKKLLGASRMPDLKWCSALELSSFTVYEHTQTTIEIRAADRLDAFGAQYFECTVNIDRKTNKKLSTKCTVNK